MCWYKNAGVAGYAEAFRPVQSDSQTSEWYSYFENDVLAWGISRPATNGIENPGAGTPGFLRVAWTLSSFCLLALYHMRFLFAIYSIYFFKYSLSVRIVL